MKRVLCLLAAGVMIAVPAMPQDLLPPGVLLLSRIKRHVKEELARLPNISCLQTVQREYQPAGGKMRPLDTVRLEVLSNGLRELYASPGERKFSENHPAQYTGGGVIGNGFFGMFLKAILVDGNASYEYKGEEERDGRRLARYEFRLPPGFSGYTINLQEGSGTVGLHGSFWAEPRTYDVVRLEMNADDFPPALPLTEAVTAINYAPTSLGENQTVLLPESGDFRMTRFSGEINHNRIAFTHCRLFGAQSTISFAAPGDISNQPVQFGASSNDDTLRPLPAGLQVAVRLSGRIPEDATVGTLIYGAVAANVPAKGPVVIAAGSRVTGRIRRLERNEKPVRYFVVAIEFTELESDGIRYRFDADLVSMEGARDVGQTLTVKRQDQSQYLDSSREIRQHIEELWLPDLPGVANFFVQNAKLDLPAHFQTIWKTRRSGQ